MKGVQALLIAGALFKRKKDPVPPTPDDKSKEAAIRKKVDDLRAREDEVRDKESVLDAREEKLAGQEGQIAHRLQEIAIKENELKARLAGAPRSEEKPEKKKEQKENLPGDSDTVEGQMQVIRTLEERLTKARSRLDDMNTREKKRGEFRSRMEEYRSKGFSIARLEAVIDADLQELQVIFENYHNDTTALMALSEECDTIDRAFAPEADALKARCRDPDAIEELEKGLEALKKRVDERRAQLMKSVEKWKAGGYNTARFDRLPGASVSEIEDAVTRFSEDLEVLRMFGEKLDKVDKAFSVEADVVRGRLNDPDAIASVEQEILALEQKSGTQKQEFVRILAGWKSEGYRTESVEKVLSSDLTAIQEAFLRYEEDLTRLRSLEEKASTLDQIFAPQIETIKANLKDPTVIQKIELAIQALEEETERRRGDFKAKADKYRSEGYTVSRLDGALEMDLEGLEKASSSFDADLARLNALLPRIQALEKEGRYGKELVNLGALLKEPGSHIRLERGLLELEERLISEREKEAGEKKKSARDASDREREKSEKLKREAADKERLTREAGERLEREKADRDRMEKEKAEREASEKTRKEEADRKAREEESKPKAPAPAVAGGEPPAAPGGDNLEEQVKVAITSSETVIKELEGAKVDATRASNLLKLAKSFNRSKNFAKALQYAKQAQDAAASLKK